MLAMMGAMRGSRAGLAVVSGRELLVSGGTRKGDEYTEKMDGSCGGGDGRI